MWEYVSIGGPVLLALGGLATFLPLLTASSIRRAGFIAFFIVVGVLTTVATKKESDKLSASITGGDNYAFIKVDAEAPKRADGRANLLVVNAGGGAVYDVRYWPYPGSTPLGRNDKGYWALEDENRQAPRAFAWVNPGGIYTTGQALSPGDYMIEVEARNGMVLEHLRIEENNGISEKITVTRAGDTIYPKR